MRKRSLQGRMAEANAHTHITRDMLLFEVKLWGTLMQYDNDMLNTMVVEPNGNSATGFISKKLAGLDYKARHVPFNISYTELESRFFRNIKNSLYDYRPVTFTLPDGEVVKTEISDIALVKLFETYLLFYKQYVHAAQRQPKSNRNIPDFDTYFEPAIKKLVSENGKPVHSMIENDIREKLLGELFTPLETPPTRVY